MAHYDGFREAEADAYEREQEAKRLRGGVAGAIESGRRARPAVLGKIRDKAARANDALRKGAKGWPVDFIRGGL